jgi:hypothetical protein
LRDLLVSEDLRHLVPGYWCVRSGSNPRVRLRSEALLLESGQDLLQSTAREQPAEDRQQFREHGAAAGREAGARASSAGQTAENAPEIGTSLAAKQVAEHLVHLAHVRSFPT